jgi:hypothetical protein
MQTVTRQQLQDAIEAGIEEAASGFNFDPEVLRAVGRTATEVAIGEYQIGPVGCPVMQAFPDGLLNVQGDIKFALAFDRHMWNSLGVQSDSSIAGSALIVEVID